MSIQELVLESSKMEKPIAANPRKDRNNRRQLILNKAAELFSAQGYDATSMDELSDATGLNKGTIYYYYKSKADILFDMSYNTAGFALKNASPALKMEHAVDALEHAVQVIVEWLIANRQAVTTYFQESPYFEKIFSEEQFEYIRKQQSYLMRVFYEIIAKGEKTGEFSTGNVQMSGRMIVGSMMWIYRWPEEDLNAEKISKHLMSVYLQGLPSGK